MGSVSVTQSFSPSLRSKLERFVLFFCTATVTRDWQQRLRHQNGSHGQILHVLLVKIFLKWQCRCNNWVICHEWFSRLPKMSGSSWFIRNQFSLSVATLHEIRLRPCVYSEQLQSGDAVLSCFSALIHTEWIRCQGKSCAKIRDLLTSGQKHNS